MVRNLTSSDGGITFHLLHKDDIAFHTCTYPKPKTVYVTDLYSPEQERWRIRRQAR